MSHSQKAAKEKDDFDILLLRGGVGRGGTQGEGLASGSAAIFPKAFETAQLQRQEKYV